MSTTGDLEHRDSLARVLAEFHQRADQGEKVDREQFLAKHPGLSDALREHWAALDEIEGLFDGHAGGEDSHAWNAPSVVRQLGDYLLFEEIGRGGMGRVYRARQLSLRREVAVKLIRAGSLDDEEMVRRFRNEAEAAASLDHPGIVPIFEVGEAEGQHYFSMGYVSGRSLAQGLMDGPIAPQRAAEVIRQVAEAVHYAHKRGVIHRDLKPSNILLDEPGRPRVSDFGLAKRVETDSSLTQTGATIGTPSYMPPEQASNGSALVGPASDVYGLGATLYALLTGRPPFQAATRTETIRQVIEREPVPPRRLNPAIPRDLETIALKCLEKSPGKRYATAEAFAEDLGRWLRHEPILARPISPAGRLVRWGKRNPTTAVLTTALAAVLVAAFFLVTWQWLVAHEALRGRALAQVRALQTAAPEALPVILADLAASRPLVVSRLREESRREDLSEDARTRLALALLPVDPGQQEVLRSALLDCPIAEFPAIRDALRPGSAELLPSLWSSFHDQACSSDSRLRAGLALASYAPDDPTWTDSDAKFLTDAYLRAHPDDGRALREALRPVTKRMVPPLRARLIELASSEMERRGAAVALADFASGDPALLATLASEAAPDQAAILFPPLTRNPSSRGVAIATLRAIALETPHADLDEKGRVELGRRRAGAAINGWLLGNSEGLTDATHIEGGDPEALTQFVHQARSRGLGAADLVGRLKVAGSRTEQFALLLALGDYRLEELPPEHRDALVKTLGSWYRTDPDAGIHSASAWLLRAWGLSLPDLDPKTPSMPDPKGRRNWLVRHIGDETLTFTVIPAGGFTMGTPPDEGGREKDEHQHDVRITRSFAILDREITRAEFERYLRERESPLLQFWIDSLGSTCPGPEHPALGVVWYEAVSFCRWLTQEAGLTELDQCYPDPATIPDKTRDGFPLNWPCSPERTGFRLPTESEWEYAARAGTLTRFSFGSDATWIRAYAQIDGQTNQVAPLGSRLRPNLIGLFDIHGGAFEWCHDWYGDYPVVTANDPLGQPGSGHGRILRGGGWIYPALLARSGMRNFAMPYQRDKGFGFRIVFTLPW